MAISRKQENHYPQVLCLLAKGLSVIWIRLAMYGSDVWMYGIKSVIRRELTKHQRARRSWILLMNKEIKIIM